MMTTEGIKVIGRIKESIIGISALDFRERILNVLQKRMRMKKKVGLVSEKVMRQLKLRWHHLKRFAQSASLMRIGLKLKLQIMKTGIKYTQIVFH